MRFLPPFHFFTRRVLARCGSRSTSAVHGRLLACGLSLLSAFLPIQAWAGSALTASFQVASSWDAGYSATVVVTNSGGTAVAGWTGTLATPGTLSSVWGVSAMGSGPYQLAPASYNDPIPAYGQISFGFNGTGSAVAPTLSINGQNVPFGAAVTPPATPTPTPGATPTPAPTPGAGAPGVPSVTIQQNWTTGIGFTVGWAIYSGGQATNWTLLQDGSVYATGAAAAGNAGGQTGSVSVLDRPYSAHVYQIQVSNGVGSTLSAATPYVADGASAISIGTPDATMQARQVTIPLDTPTTYPLSLVTGATGSYQLATNNATVLSFAVAGDALTVTGLRPGRASLRITDATSGAVRWLGVRVQKADGSLPGMPGYLSMGSVSEDTTPDLTMWQQFGAGALNRRLDARYIYLNDGPSNLYQSWRTWTTVDGFRATSFVRESLKLGMIPFFVWYNIDGPGDGYYTDTADARNATFMYGYYTDLKFFIDKVNAEAPGELVGVVIEPDFLGYIAQNGDNPDNDVAATDQAYAAGVLTAGVDPAFPNTITGYVQSVNYILHKYLPTAYFGWETALWGHPAQGFTVASPGNGIIHLTDTAGVDAGRPEIYKEAAATADYYIRAGVTSYGAGFISVDKYGLDAAAENSTASTNPMGSTWFWSMTHWINYLTFAQALGAETKLPVVLWQIPVGHINTSQFPNPAGGLFPTLVNNSTHYEDSAPTFFLGDTFNPGSAARLSYFGAGDGGSNPQETTAVSGASVTWPSAMSLAANFGVQCVLFGAGVGDSTQGVGTPPTDGGWWITKAQTYYDHTIPLGNPSPGLPAPSPTPAPTPTPTPVPALPTVSVAAATPLVDLASGGQGEFDLSRSGGDSTQPLRVAYLVKGTATAGVDYTALSGVATFRAGQTTVAIPVVPLDGADAAKKTVVLKIKANANYTPGTPANATIRFLAR